MYLKLSTLISLGIFGKEAVIEYLLSNNYLGISNDLPDNNVEYDIEDIEIVWDRFLVSFDSISYVN